MQEPGVLNAPEEVPHHVEADGLAFAPAVPGTVEFSFDEA
jgi:hypothetical protein